MGNMGPNISFFKIGLSIRTSLIIVIGKLLLSLEESCEVNNTLPL